MKPISTLSLISVCAAASLLIVSCGEQTPSEQAAPAQTKAMAETAQPVELKMTSAFPLSLTLIGVAGPEFADIVKRASGGRIQVEEIPGDPYGPFGGPLDAGGAEKSAHNSAKVT